MATDSVDKVSSEMEFTCGAINSTAAANRLITAWADRLRALSPVLTAEERAALKRLELGWTIRPDDIATLCATIRRFVPGVTP